MLECAVIDENGSRETLISLEMMKKWGILHPTFPNESIEDFVNRNGERQPDVKVYGASHPYYDTKFITPYNRLEEADTITWQADRKTCPKMRKNRRKEACL